MKRPWNRKVHEKGGERGEVGEMGGDRWGACIVHNAWNRPTLSAAGEYEALNWEWKGEGGRGCGLFLSAHRPTVKIGK